MISKKIITVLFLVTGLCLMFFSQSKSGYAQEATEMPSQLVIDKIKDRLEKELDKSNTEPALNQNEKDVIFGYFGELSKFENKNLISIESAKGIQSIKIDENTKINSTKSGVKDTLDADDLEEMNEGFLLAVGYKDESQSLKAERISFFAKPTPAPVRNVYFGYVKEIESDQVIVSAADEEKTLLFDSDTIIKLNTGRIIKTDRIQIDDQITVVTKPETKKDGTTSETLLQVMIAPGKNNPIAIENQINASPSSEEETTDDEEE